MSLRSLILLSILFFVLAACTAAPVTSSPAPTGASLVTAAPETTAPPPTFAPTIAPTEPQLTPPLTATTAAAAKIPTREKYSTFGYIDRDVTYCTTDGVESKLDIYFPLTPKRAHAPTLVYFHGNPGKKGGVNPLIEFLRAGYIVVDADYRQPPDFKLPAAIQDAKCAIRFLRANADTYQLDPNAIGAYGCSFGSFVAAMLGVTNDFKEFDGNGGYSDQSSRVEAAVPVSGIYNWVTTIDAQDSNGELPDTFGIQTRNDSILAHFSPLSYVDKSDVPFLLVQGDNDIYEDLSDAQGMYAALQKAQVDSELLVMHDGGHCLHPTTQTTPSYKEIIQRMIQFFDRTLP